MMTPLSNLWLWRPRRINILQHLPTMQVMTALSLRLPDRRVCNRRWCLTDRFEAFPCKYPAHRTLQKWRYGAATVNRRSSRSRRQRTAW